MGGNTGTSHELNRTANSSTREGGAGSVGAGPGCGGDRSLYITLRTHTHTQKKRDTSCISGQSLRANSDVCPRSASAAILFLCFFFFNDGEFFFNYCYFWISSRPSH